MKIAVVGTGIAGLATAYLLHTQHDVVVYEAADRAGGHTHTVRVDLADETHHIDCGFIVHNDRNYPLLTRLFRELQVATQPSEMTFSVINEKTGCEWNGKNLATMFAQPRNMLRPSFLKMLTDIASFNKQARALLQSNANDNPTLEEFLQRHSLSGDVVTNYIVPLGSAIWSANPATFTAFPARTLFHFLDNHGLLRVAGRPTWRSVQGGASTYVERITRILGDRVRLSTPVASVARHDNGVTITTTHGATDTYDHVVLACHTDEVLGLLSHPTPIETDILRGFSYQPNVVTLHTDTALLPKAKRAWASWNYHVTTTDRSLPTVTYHMNRLQKLTSSHQFLVTLNREHEIDPLQVLHQVVMSHPVYDHRTVASQQRLAEIQGTDRVWFAGAGWGHGFHEDGMRSAVAVAEALGVTW